MAGFVARRLFQLVLVLFGVATLIFTVMVVVPEGDPAKTIVPRATSPAVLEEVRKEWGFDKSVTTQYLQWMGDLAQLDLRTSYTGGKRPVAELLAERYPRSLTLALIAIMLEVIIGIAVGVITAVRRESFWDRLYTVSLAVLVALPVFWIGTLLQYMFGWANWMPSFFKLPPVGYEPITAPGGWKFYILPAITMAAVSLAILARIVRTEMTELMEMDFVRTARAMGLREPRIFFKHVLKNAMIPVVTFIAIDLGTIIGSAIVTEAVFSFEGVGSAIIEAVNSGNTPVVMGFTLVLSAIFVVLNFIADISYAAFDPRMREAVLQEQ